MKKAILIFSVSILGLTILKAQCTGCTNTISSNISTGIIVNAGQTYCINASVIVRGGILINSGGTVCNQGIIRAGIAIAQGGTLNNYATIDSSDAGGIANAGLLNNYGTIGGWIDTVGIGNDGTLNNFGTIKMDSGGIANRDTLNNYGVIVINAFDVLMGGYFLNAGGASMDIHGGCNVGDPISSAKVENFGCMHVGLGFENYATSSFATATMVKVDGGWTNLGTVSGLGSSCGGFKVLQGTSNFGTYGATGNVDMCDAGTPVSGFDLNLGTVGSGVTYCQCTNYCTILGMDDSERMLDQALIYPNPIHSNFTIKISSELDIKEAILKIYDLVGQEVRTVLIHDNEVLVDRGALLNGIYFYSVFNKNEKIAGGKLIVQ